MTRQPTNKPWNRTANDEQLAVFSNGYVPATRIAVLEAIGLALDRREELLGALALIEPCFCDKDDSFLFGPMTSGLLAAAVSEAVMAAEDLFALLPALRDPTRFVHRVVAYNAGRIPQTADRLARLTETDTASAFFIPDATFLDPDSQAPALPAILQSARTRLREQLRFICKWWKRHEFMQRQYKHGLSLALKPFDGSLPDSTIQRRRTSRDGVIYAYDTASINDRSIERSGGVIALVAGDLTRAHAGELAEDNNLLRYVLREVSWADLARVARSAYRLQITALENRIALSSNPPDYRVLFSNESDENWTVVHTEQSPPPVDAFSLQL